MRITCAGRLPATRLHELYVVCAISNPISPTRQANQYIVFDMLMTFCFLPSRSQIEITARPLIMTSMYSKAERVRELPPELVDRIIDFLHDEPRVLASSQVLDPYEQVPPIQLGKD